MYATNINALDLDNIILNLIRTLNTYKIQAHHITTAYYMTTGWIFHCIEPVY